MARISSRAQEIETKRSAPFAMIRSSYRKRNDPPKMKGNLSYGYHCPHLSLRINSDGRPRPSVIMGGPEPDPYNQHQHQYNEEDDIKSYKGILIGMAMVLAILNAV